MINAVVDRNLWWSWFNRYQTRKIRLLDVEKDGLRHLIIQPLDWMTPLQRTVYISYKGARYKIKSLEQLHPDYLYEIVYDDHASIYKLKVMSNFLLTEYVEE